jgi:DNA polymerase III subunit delta
MMERQSLSSNRPVLGYTGLMKRLDQGQVEPSYYFYGPEDALMERALRRLKEVALEPASAEFNWDVYRADDEINWASFADSLNSLPMLASRRVVVLKKAGRAQQIKNAAGVIERAILRPEPDLTLVLIDEDFDAKKPPAGLRKKIFEHSLCVEFPFPGPADLQMYLRDYARQFKKELSDEALTQILSDSSPSLRELLAKLEVLVFYLGEKEVAEAQDVEACTAFSREVEVFKLLQALGVRDRTATRLILQQLLRSRGEIGSLIHLLYRQIWALYKMKYLQEKKIPAQQWQSQLNLKPQFLERRYREYLPYFTRRELGISLELLAQTDRLRKTAAIDDPQLFSTLIESLLDPSRDKLNPEHL